MGCIESSVNKAFEMNFEKTKPSRTSVLVIRQNTLNQNEDEIKIDEKQLCDDNLTVPIVFTTTKNDIEPLKKSVIIQKAAEISKSAVQKLLVRRGSEKEHQKIKIDDSKLQRGIKKDINRKN